MNWSTFHVLFGTSYLRMTLWTIIYAEGSYEMHIFRNMPAHGTAGWMSRGVVEEGEGECKVGSKT